MNKNATVLCHNAGLFSLINKVVTCLGLYERIHVDFSKGQTCLYSTPEKANLWNCLFEPTQPIDGPSDEIIDYPDSSITWRNVAKLYAVEDGWRQRYNALWRKILPLESVSRSALDFVEGSIGKQAFICAQVRANTHLGEQVTERSQSLEEYERAINSVRGRGEPLYVACDNHETLAWFEQRLNPVVWFPNTNRSPNRDSDYHVIEKQTHQDAINCLTEVLIMSWSRMLIHPVSNMATGALYMNPNMQHVYLP